MLYKNEKISLRQAAELTGLTVRETLDEFGKEGVYIRYGKDELDEGRNPTNFKNLVSILMNR